MSGKIGGCAAGVGDMGETLCYSPLLVCTANDDDGKQSIKRVGLVRTWSLKGKGWPLADGFWRLT
jgi:hypothetical protein